MSDPRPIHHLSPSTTYQWEADWGLEPFFGVDLTLSPEARNFKVGDYVKVDDKLHKIYTLQEYENKDWLGICGLTQGYSECSSGMTRWGVNPDLIGGYFCWSDGSIDSWGSYAKRGEE